MRPYATYPAKREPVLRRACGAAAAAAQPDFCEVSMEVKPNFEETGNAADGVGRHRIGV
jgi:hypothetical protein